MTVTGEYPDSFVVQMNLSTVAVVFDFMNPLVPLRRLHFQRRQLRLNEARHFRFLTHYSLTKNENATLALTISGQADAQVLKNLAPQLHSDADRMESLDRPA
jgi:hypothetical protein